MRVVTWDILIRTLFECIVACTLNSYLDDFISEFPFIFKRIYQRFHDSIFANRFSNYREKFSKPLGHIFSSKTNQVNLSSVPRGSNAMVEIGTRFGKYLAEIKRLSTSVGRV